MSFTLDVDVLVKRYKITSYKRVNDWFDWNRLSKNKAIKANVEWKRKQLTIYKTVANSKKWLSKVQTGWTSAGLLKGGAMQSFTPSLSESKSSAVATLFAIVFFLQHRLLTFSVVWIETVQKTASPRHWTTRQYCQSRQRRYRAISDRPSAPPAPLLLLLRPAAAPAGRTGSLRLQLALHRYTVAYCMGVSSGSTDTLDSLAIINRQQLSACHRAVQSRWGRRTDGVLMWCTV